MLRSDLGWTCDSWAVQDGFPVKLMNGRPQMSFQASEGVRWIKNMRMREFQLPLTTAAPRTRAWKDGSAPVHKANILVHWSLASAAIVKRKNCELDETGSLDDSLSENSLHIYCNIDEASVCVCVCSYCCLYAFRNERCHTKHYGVPKVFPVSLWIPAFREYWWGLQLSKTGWIVSERA